MGSILESAEQFGYGIPKPAMKDAAIKSDHRTV